MPARALSGPFQIDRTTPPQRFYTLKEAQGHFQPGVHVFARSNHPTADGYEVMGLVSNLSPFGQGTEYPFRLNQLRLATPNEIREALEQDHATKNSNWRPECPEIRDLSVLLTGGVCDDEELTALVRRSKAEAKRFRIRARQSYGEILQRWRAITRSQAATILASLPR